MQQSHSELISTFIATHGVRRFDRGDCGNMEAIRDYLNRRGYRLSMERGLYKITGGRIGRPKRSGWKGVIEFVDCLRVSEGKQPIRRRA